MIFFIFAKLYLINIGAADVPLWLPQSGESGEINRYSVDVDL